MELSITDLKLNSLEIPVLDKLGSSRFKMFRTLENYNIISSLHETKLDRKKEKGRPLTSIYIFSTPKKCSADRVKNRALLGETKATTSVVSPVLVKLRPMYTGAEKKKIKTLYDTPNFSSSK